MLHVGGQQQRGGGALFGGRHRIGQGGARGGAGRGDEGAQSGGLQHAGGVEALVVRPRRVHLACRLRLLAIDDQQLRAHAAGGDRGVQAVGGGGAAANDGDAEAAGGKRIAFRHRDGVVLMPRAVEGDAETVQRGAEHGGVIAHQAEHGVDAQGLDVLGDGLVGLDDAAGAARGVGIHESPPCFADKRRTGTANADEVIQ